MTVRQILTISCNTRIESIEWVHSQVDACKDPPYLLELLVRELGRPQHRHQLKDGIRVLMCMYTSKVGADMNKSGIVYFRMCLQLK